LRTISIFIIRGSDGSKNTGLFAIFLRRTMEILLNILVYSPFNHMTWLISQRVVYLPYYIQKNTEYQSHSNKGQIYTATDCFKKWGTQIYTGYLEYIMNKYNLYLSSKWFGNATHC